MTWTQRPTKSLAQGGTGAWLLVTALCFMSMSAHACSCTRPDRASSFVTADEVVGGEIVRITQSDGQIHNVLQVGKRWKGGSAAELLLRSDGPCGFQFESGEAYLVFARLIANDIFYVSQCSGTQRFGQSPALLRQLEQREP